MSTGKTCGGCQYFSKVNWNDRPDSITFGRNGLCEKYDYNVGSDSSYAKNCQGYKGKRFKRIKLHNNLGSGQRHSNLLGVLINDGGLGGKL